jgi:alpha-galactosidase/6-phospho-beta-glucosidase family protein
MLNVVFVGGGSLRLVPILRALMQTPGLMDGASIRLVDLQLDRAEAVGTMIRRSPEFKNTNCQVTWTDDMDRALDGADVLYVTMAMKREPSDHLARKLSADYNYMYTDQLSINGAFLCARGGPLIMNFARKMEKYCPDALMLLFCNPVQAFATAVTNHTKIKALGICGGYSNHRWDLARICGRDICDTGWDVVAAGVNHFSFILRGTYQGRKLEDVIDETIAGDWAPIEIATSNQNEAIRVKLQQLVNIYKRFGHFIFSTEPEGLGFLHHSQTILDQKEEAAIKLAGFDVAETPRQLQAEMEANFAEFRKLAMGAEEPDWTPEYYKNRLTGVATGDITVPILKAIAGMEKMRITASHPNINQAVRGLPEGAALEYTMDLDGKSITPVEDLYIPSPFQGIISACSEHQTLLAKAIATNDGKAFADALEAFPMNQFEANRVDFFRGMFDIFTDITPELQAGRNFLNWQ